MIERYADAEITSVWSNENKLALWQKTELAVIHARADLGLIEESDFQFIEKRLSESSIDIAWWLEREKETNHDLAAFVDERMRFLPAHLQRHLHDGMTSYDTEEPA